MKINVKTLQGLDCYPIVSEEMSVLELKYLVTTEMDVPVERMRLMFKGKAMQDSMTLQECGVTQNSKIYLSIKDSSSVERPLSAAATTCKSTTSRDGSSSSDLSSLLMSLLLKHFSPSDAERVADEFKRQMKSLVDALSLDDIERIAKANLLQK